MARPKKGDEKGADTTISMRLPTPLKEAMQALADREHRTFTAQCTVAMIEHLDKHGIDWNAGKAKRAKR